MEEYQAKAEEECKGQDYRQEKEIGCFKPAEAERRRIMTGVELLSIWMSLYPNINTRSLYPQRRARSGVLKGPFAIQVHTKTVHYIIVIDVENIFARFHMPHHELFNSTMKPPKKGKNEMGVRVRSLD